MISLSDISATNATVNATSLNSTTDLTSPTIKSISPANKAINVVTSKTIKVTFNEPIKKGTGYIRLKNSAGKSIYITTSISGNILTIDPTVNLARGANYYLYIYTGSVTDLSCNRYAYSGIRTFKTDGTAPTIKSTSPINKATNVVTSKTIKVTFSESIKKGTGYIRLKNSAGKSIYITTSINGNVLTVNPTSNLARGANYYLYIYSGSITDLSGNKYVYSGSRTFKTDGTAPTIKSISPLNKTINVAVNKVIKVTFSESIKKGTGTIVLKDNRGKAIAFTTSISGNVLTIKPTNNLTNGTKYYLYICSGSVIDLSGNKYVYKGSTTFTTYSANIHGVWLPSYYASTVNVTALTKTNITDIFIKVNQTNYKSVLTTILNRVSGTGIRIHAWITCFKYSNGSWANPQNSTYVNSLISFISSVTKYSVNGMHVSGIHLDYVRYPGTAYKYNGTIAITAFVQKVYNTVKSINSSITVSAALMPERSVNGYYYGQDYAQLSKYLNFMVIMAYKGNYGYDSSTGTSSSGKSGTEWIASTIKYIVSQANGTPVVAGLQTYRSDSNVTAIPASELQNDINAAINNGSSGYVLFRYGLIDDNFMDI
ncbi:Ig-like domain-containing protein [Methanobacterium sp.]|uniref:Ig-like domain-containing protein n=1 Tax=Methanobacterium sp. TaxID=2164 RepID=UPI003C768F6D